MTLNESLSYLADALVGITLRKDPHAFRMAYKSRKARILEYWTEAKPKLRRDVDRIAPIDALMDEMFYAFESGNQDKGVLIAMALWGCGHIKKLR